MIINSNINKIYDKIYNNDDYYKIIFKNYNKDENYIYANYNINDYDDIPKELLQILNRNNIKFKIKEKINIDTNSFKIIYKIKLNNDLNINIIKKFIFNIIINFNRNNDFTEISYDFNYDKDLYLNNEENFFNKMLLIILYNYIDFIIIPNFKKKYYKKINNLINK